MFMILTFDSIKITSLLQLLKRNFQSKNILKSLLRARARRTYGRYLLCSISSFVFPKWKWKDENSFSFSPRGELGLSSYTYVSTVEILQLDQVKPKKIDKIRTWARTREEKLKTTRSKIHLFSFFLLLWDLRVEKNEAVSHYSHVSFTKENISKTTKLIGSLANHFRRMADNFINSQQDCPVSAAIPLDDSIANMIWLVDNWSHLSQQRK